MSINLKTDIRSVREAAIESISSILECTGTNNLNIVRFNIGFPEIPSKTVQNGVPG